MLGSDSHPIAELCHRSSPASRWIFPCGDSPREFQTALFQTTTENRLFLNPKSLLRENAMRFVKSTLMKGDELIAFRSYDGPEFSLIWHAIRQLDDEGNVRSIVDYINIGGDEADEYYSISVFWSGFDRQETIVRSLTSSFAFDPGTEELAASLLEEGRRTRSALPILSAIEIAKDKLPAAEVIYGIYARDGLPFEKSQFAKWVSSQVEEGDLRLMDLNEKVWDWRADEKDSERK